MTCRCSTPIPMEVEGRRICEECGERLPDPREERQDRLLAGMARAIASIERRLPAQNGSKPDAAPATHLLTAEQLADRWQVPKAQVYRLTREARLPAVRLGRYYRYAIEAIEEFELSGGVTEKERA